MEFMTPEIIAHRGASYLAPENTLSAFRKAMEIGADGVEMDVQQTSDKKLVIHHDFVIDWHTDMRGQIYDMTEGELKALDFGSWKDVNYRNERIATLQEALALCREMEGTIVQLEMKATIDDDPDFVPRVIEAVRAANITDEKLVALLVMLGSITTPACYVMAKQMGHEGVLTGSVCVTTTLFSAFSLTFWLFVLRSLGYIL